LSRRAARGMTRAKVQDWEFRVLKTIASRMAVAGLALVVASCGSQDANKANAPAAPVAAVPPPAGSDWTEVVKETPDGGFLMGNPDAPVKLVEYASLTCPHCAAFSMEAGESLRNNFIKSGKVSWEFRNFLLQPVDVAVSLLARCQGPGPFFKLVEQIFAEQANWGAKFQNISKAEQDRIQALPEQARIGAIAKAGQLDAFFRARGIPEAKIDACLADKAATDELVKIRQQAVDKGVQGTPSFFLNGTLQDNVYDWASLEPKLRAATGG
jgi:protein-disulfide isomerase